MSAALRSFMEAYNAVHNQEARGELYAKRDELSEMDFSLVSDVELEEIAEMALQELFEKGFSVNQADAIFDNLITEAKVTYGHDTESARQAKVQRLKGALKGAIGKARMKSARGAVAAYGAYRSAKQTADDIRRRTTQTAKNVSAQTAKKASEAKAGVKTGLKGMIRKAAEKVASKASGVAKRMDEQHVEEGLKSAIAGAGLAAAVAAHGAGKKPEKYTPASQSGSQVTRTAPAKSGSEAWAKAHPGLAAKEASTKKPASVKNQLSDIRDMIARSKARQQSESLQVSEAKKGDGNLANNYPPYDKVTRGDVIAGALGKDQMGGKKKKKGIDEATAMAKRGYDEAPIRQKIAKSTGGGKAADRATDLEKKSTFGDANKQKQRERYARAQRGDFRKTTSSSPGLHGYAHKSDDAGVKAKQAARGAQRGALTPAEKKQFNREEFDLFDMIMEFLCVEGFAETLEEAEWMMANMIDEEAIDIILGEDSRRTSNKQHTARVRSNIKAFGSNYTPPRNYDPDANRGQGEVLTRRQIEKKRRKALRQEEFELWVNALVEEGYDLSGYTWDEMYEFYLDEDAGIISGLAGLALGARGASYAAKHSKRMRDYPKNFVKGIVDPRTYAPKKKKEQKEAFEAWLDEAMTNYEKNRKRAAQRAAARNAARDQGKTGAVPGVGYVTPRRERETWTDESGKTRHAKGL